jgi:osmotically-inducible protein OsmY
MRALTLLLILATPLLTGCAGLVVGAAATGGVLAVQERGFKTATSDIKIATEVKERHANLDPELVARVSVNVLQNDVLLTGVAPTTSAMEKVVELTENHPKVDRVYNELMVVDYPAKQIAKDSWTATQARARMLGSADIYTVNYSIEVFHGQLYVIGIAKSNAEKERALHVLRTTRGVDKVYDYIRLTSKN